MHAELFCNQDHSCCIICNTFDRYFWGTIMHRIAYSILECRIAYYILECVPYGMTFCGYGIVRKVKNLTFDLK